MNNEYSNFMPSESERKRGIYHFMTIRLFILTNSIAKIMQSIAYYLEIQGAYSIDCTRVEISRENSVNAGSK